MKGQVIGSAMQQIEKEEAEMRMMGMVERLERWNMQKNASKLTIKSIKTDIVPLTLPIILQKSPKRSSKKSIKRLRTKM